MSNEQTPVTWQSIKGGLPVIVTIIVLIVSLATFVARLQAQINYQDARLCVIEADRREAAVLSRDNEARWAAVQQTIEVRLAEIQRDIAYIRVELDKR